MNEIKVRYTFRRKSDGFIEQSVYSIQQIEADAPNVNHPHWETISRDLWTQLKDKKGNEIYAGDINQDNGTLKWWVVEYVWEYPNGDRHEIDGTEDEWCEITGNIHINPSK